MTTPNVGDVPIYVGPQWMPGPVPLSPNGVGAIIYKPGGVSAGDTVATWPEVQAFITKADGKCIVYVDDSITSPAPVPQTSGITDCLARVELRAAIIDPQNISVLQVEGGATLRNLYCVTDLELRCNPDATIGIPSLDYTLAPNGGFLLLQQYAILSNALTATDTAITVPAGKALRVLLNTEASIKLTNPDHSIFAVAAGTTLEVQAFNASSIALDFAEGAGTVTLTYDNPTAFAFPTPGTPPSLDLFTGTYTTTNLDDVIVTQTFLVSQLNIFQQGPETGIRPVTFKGCGGGGGGSGGSGGIAAGPPTSGSGGAGGGGAMYQEVTVDVDFSHQIDIVVDTGGGGGSGGVDGGGEGTPGSDGGPTYAVDSTTGTVLCAFVGASAGQPGVTTGGGLIEITQGGSNVSGSQFATSTGFVAAGGGGGGPGTIGSPGVSNINSFGAPIATAPTWLPGVGGTTAAIDQGGGGGGGGQGPFGNGGAGGNGNAAVGSNGLPGDPNSGAGGGGGAGGGSAAGSSGSAAGAGGAGKLIASYRA